MCTVICASRSTLVATVDFPALTSVDMLARSGFEGPQLLAVTSPAPQKPETLCALGPEQRQQPGPAPVLQLQARLAEAFAAEKAQGVTIGSQQPPESAARLDETVRGLIQDYLVEGHEDWKDYVAWNVCALGPARPWKLHALAA